MVVAVSEATRIVGNGLGDLITSPINSSGGYNFTVGDSGFGTEATILGIAGLYGGYKLYKSTNSQITSGVTGMSDSRPVYGPPAPAGVKKGPIQGSKDYLFGNSTTNQQSFFGRNKEIILWILLFVVMPIALIVLSIFLTLIFRQGLLILLAMTAPIACALYVLPGTEKYFKKWWDLFIKTLFVYPIIVAIFAISDVLASVIFNAFGDNTIGIIAGLIAMFAPAALIPFSFKFAGGAIGTIYGTLTGGGKRFGEALKGNANDPNSLRNSTKRNAAGNIVRNRAQFVRENANQPRASWRRGLARKLNYGDLFDRESAINEEAQKRMGRTTGAGDDIYVRARSSLALYRRADGGETTDVRKAARDLRGEAVRVRDKDGNAVRASMNGQKRFTDYDYDKSRQLYRTMGELQEAVNYEAKKALTDGDTDTLLENYGLWAQQEGLQLQQAQGLYTGVAFARQGERLELKHGSVQSDGAGGFRIVGAAGNMGSKINSTTGDVQQLGGRDSFVQELYDKKGSWAVSQMHDSTINEVAQAKESYASEIRSLSKREAAGQLTREEKARLDLSRKQLNNIQEMEDSWIGTTGITGGVIPGEGDGASPTPAYSGLSGAAEGVQRAAKRMATRKAVLADGSQVTTRNRYDQNGNRVLLADEVNGPPAP